MRMGQPADTPRCKQTSTQQPAASWAASAFSAILSVYSVSVALTLIFAIIVIMGIAAILVVVDVIPVTIINKNKNDTSKHNNNHNLYMQGHICRHTYTHIRIYM